MTNADLARDWRKYGIFSFGSDAFRPLVELYSECLGLQEEGVRFQFQGTDGKSPHHFSMLHVAKDGMTCYDGKMCVGEFRRYSKAWGH